MVIIEMIVEIVSVLKVLKIFIMIIVQVVRLQHVPSVQRFATSCSRCWCLAPHRVAWGYWLRVVGIRPVEARGPQAGGGGVGCRRNRWYKGGGLPKLGVHGRPYLKDYSILGPIWGPAIFGSYRVAQGHGLLFEPS